MIEAECLAEVVAALDAGRLRDCSAVSGGDTSAAWRLELSQARVFLKTAPLGQADRLLAERDGLEALAASKAIRVPQRLANAATRQIAWLALEWLDLEPATPESDAHLGTALARLHRTPQPQIGWQRDNYIGLTEQPNGVSDDWLDFFSTQRLGFQLRLAHGHDRQLDQLGDRLLARLAELFVGYRPEPSLLHGDLWSGNKARVGQEAVIFDPAVYCGDREADLAMTSLFGGFHADFYRAYEAAWPLAEGSARRMEIYRLYHVLNHFNLFGGAYLSQAKAILRNSLSGVD